MAEMSTQDALNVIHKAATEYARLDQAAAVLLNKEHDLNNLTTKIAQGKTELERTLSAKAAAEDASRKASEKVEAEHAHALERLATQKQAEIDRWAEATEKVQKAHAQAKDDHVKTIARQNAEITDLGGRRADLEREILNLESRLKDVKRAAKDTADTAAALAR